MLSYLTMLVLIMFFMHRLQHGPAIEWKFHAFGYAAALGLVATTIYALAGRARKTWTHYKHSHETDWIFLVLLLVVTLTGIAQHLLHRGGWEAAANIVYVAHMMGVVPMLVLEVPFSKWSHMAYRPLGMYFSTLREKALLADAKEEKQGTRPAPAAQTA